MNSKAGTSNVKFDHVLGIASPTLSFKQLSRWDAIKGSDAARYVNDTITF